MGLNILLFIFLIKIFISEKQPLSFRITYKSELKETKIGKVLTILGMDETGEVAIVIMGKESERYYEELKVATVAIIIVH